MSIKLEIVGSGINEDLKFYNSAGLKEFTQCIREQLGGSHQKQTGPAISPATDIVELLERLVTLREKGVLTEEEFITEKKKILSK